MPQSKPSSTIYFQEEKESKPTEQVSLSSSPRFNIPRSGTKSGIVVSQLTGRRRSIATSQQDQPKPQIHSEKNTGRNLYRRAPASSSRHTSHGATNSLGSGLWYVWDPKRKRGTMRGYTSSPRNAGFKDRFRTTNSADFCRSNTQNSDVVPSSQL